MEKFLYEVRPILFILGGLFGILSENRSSWTIGAGGLLIACGIMITLWRMKNRGFME